MAFGNPMEAMKIMGLWNKFKTTHPKFPAFLEAVARRGVNAGTVFEIIVTDENGEKIETSLKIQPEDMELFDQLKKMKG